MEAQAMSVALGFVEWATLCLQDLIHGPFDLQGAPSVMQERPPVCVTDCKSLYDHLSADEKTVNAARQATSHRCVDQSRVREEDRLCDTLGTHWATIGRRSHER